MNKPFELLAVDQAVKKLFAGRYFDICTLDQIGEMLGRNPSQHPNYKFLRGLHCVDYRDMPAELRDQLEQKVVECLSGNWFNPARVTQSITDEGRDFEFTEDRYIDAPQGKLFKLAGRKEARNGR